MTIEENDRLGDLLKYEIDKNYCREVMTVAKGQNLKMGTIVEVDSEISEIKSLSISSEKETENANDEYGILLEDIDTTDKAQKALVAVRNVIVASNYLIFPTGVTEDQKKKITGDLNKRGIVIRKSA